MSDLPPVETPTQEETPAAPAAPAAKPKATSEKDPMPVIHIVLIVIGSVLALAGAIMVWRSYYGKKDTILTSGLSNQYVLQPPSIASGIASSAASSIGPVSTYTLTPPPVTAGFSPRTGMAQPRFGMNTPLRAVRDYTNSI